LMYECFLPYILNFEKCVEAYNKAVKIPQFIEFERECERDPRGSLLSLTDILIMPVQRLPRYHLLFEQLKKYTPEDHVDYPTICDALEQIGDLCVQCNDDKKKHELMEVAWDLKVLVEYNDNLVEIITPIYLDWTVKEVMDRLRKKISTGPTAEYGLYMESRKIWMDETAKFINYHKDFEKDPEGVLLFQKKGHYSRKSRSLPKSFMNMLFSNSATKMPDIPVTPTNARDSPKLLASAYRANATTSNSPTRKPTLAKNNSSSGPSSPRTKSPSPPPTTTTTTTTTTPTGSPLHTSVTKVTKQKSKVALPL